MICSEPFRFVDRLSFLFSVLSAIPKVDVFSLLSTIPKSNYFSVAFACSGILYSCGGTVAPCRSHVFFSCGGTVATCRSHVFSVAAPPWHPAARFLFQLRRYRDTLPLAFCFSCGGAVTPCRSHVLFSCSGAATPCRSHVFVSVAAVPWHPAARMFFIQWPRSRDTLPLACVCQLRRYRDTLPRACFVRSCGGIVTPCRSHVFSVAAVP